MRGQEINVEDDIHNVNHPNGRIEALMRALQVECERVTVARNDAQRERNNAQRERNNARRERDDATVELNRVTVERDGSIAVINRIRAFLRSNYRVELLCEVVDMSDLNETTKNRYKQLIRANRMDLLPQYLTKIAERMDAFAERIEALMH